MFRLSRFITAFVGKIKPIKGEKILLRYLHISCPCFLYSVKLKSDQQNKQLEWFLSVKNIVNHELHLIGTFTRNICVLIIYFY